MIGKMALERASGNVREVSRQRADGGEAIPEEGNGFGRACRCRYACGSRRKWQFIHLCSLECAV